MGYKPMLPNAHIPQRVDGPYGGGPNNGQRFGMRGMVPSGMGQQQQGVMQGDLTRPTGGYHPPPYPAQGQQQWPPMQQMTNSHHGQPNMPGGQGVPYQQTNNNSFLGSGPQQTSTASSQNFTGSSTATSSTVVSTANSTSEGGQNNTLTSADGRVYTDRTYTAQSSGRSESARGVETEMAKTEEEKEKEVLQKHILGLSSEVVKIWRFLGRRLGVKEADIEAIEKDKDSERERAYQVLMKWTEQTPLPLAQSVEILKKALKDEKREDLCKFDQDAGRR